MTNNANANSVTIELLKGTTVVATSKERDVEAPTSISILYRETMTADSTFTFQIKSVSTETIAATYI